MLALLNLDSGMPSSNHDGSLSSISNESNNVIHNKHNIETTPLVEIVSNNGAGFILSSDGSIGINGLKFIWCRLMMVGAMDIDGDQNPPIYYVDEMEVDEKEEPTGNPGGPQDSQTDTSQEASSNNKTINQSTPNLTNSKVPTNSSTVSSNSSTVSSNLRVPTNSSGGLRDVKKFIEL